MTNKKRFLLAVAILFAVASVVCAFCCSRFAPRSVRHQKEMVFADARTLVAAVRYLATPELPNAQRDVTQWEMFTTNSPQAARPPRRIIANTNVASLAISNPATGMLPNPAVHG